VADTVRILDAERRWCVCHAPAAVEAGRGGRGIYKLTDTVRILEERRWCVWSAIEAAGTPLSPAIKFKDILVLVSDV